MPSSQPRLLVFVPVDGAPGKLPRMLDRLPSPLRRENVEILVIDDSSSDDTFRTVSDDAAKYRQECGGKITVLRNREKQSYGGTRKLGCRYAIEHGFDFVAVIPSEGQRASECLPGLLAPLLAGQADAVFGSCGLTRRRTRLGGRVLTRFQKALLGTSFGEFHGGCRLYSVRALQRVPFEANTNDFHFDAEIIVQFVRAGLRIVELPVPPSPGDEERRSDGPRRAWGAYKTLLRAKLHEKSLSYHRKFDVAAETETYDLKLGYASSHTMAIDAARPKSSVLDVGCGQGHVARELLAKGCRVTGLDQYAPTVDGKTGATDAVEFIRWNLDARELPVDVARFDQIMMLDIIEHLHDPENFMEELRSAARCRRPEIILTTANIGFILTRLALLCGAFNYGKVGILDRTHTRLFTFRSLCALLEQTGYRVLAVEGVPVPFPKALGDHWLSRGLLAVNRALIRVSKGLFSYQIFVRAQATPTVSQQLGETMADNAAADAGRTRDLAA